MPNVGPAAAHDVEAGWSDMTNHSAVATPLVDCALALVVGGDGGLECLQRWARAVVARRWR